MANFDYLVFIGRFQPFHQGHYQVVKTALQHAKKVIMVIGSTNSPRTIKNPFSFDERKQMILASFDDADAARIACVGCADDIYNDHQWLINVQNAIKSVTQHEHAPTIGIIGHDKDESSYYLQLFPQYAQFLVDNFQGLSATPLRNAYFGDDVAAKTAIERHLTDASRAFLQAFATTEHYQRLQAEFAHIAQSKQAYANAPYPPSFITADAIVVQSGHILLIERDGDYGRGLYALPGGFVDNGETFLAAAIRELHEETALNIDGDTLKKYLKSSELFDEPKRSLRGRTVTVAHYFELPPTQTLPQVMGQDDAKRAFWLPLSELDARLMFEDHHSIISKMLGV